MENFLSLFLPLAAKYGPGILVDAVAAFKKAGYSVAQVDAAFSDLRPLQSFNINPNAPVQPESAPAQVQAPTVAGFAPIGVSKF